MLRFTRKGSEETEQVAPPAELCNSELASEEKGESISAAIQEPEVKLTQALPNEMDEIRENKAKIDSKTSQESDQALYVGRDASSMNYDDVQGLAGRSSSNNLTSNCNGVMAGQTVIANTEIWPIQEETYEYCDIRSPKKPVYNITDSADDAQKTAPRRHDATSNGDVYSVPHHVMRPRRPPWPPGGINRRNGRNLAGMKPVSFQPFDPTYKKYRAVLRSTSGKTKAPSKVTRSLKKDKKNDLKVSFRDDDSIIQSQKSLKRKKNAKLLEIQECKPLKESTEKDNYDSDDNLSIASEDSAMSESDLKPRNLKLRRTVAHMFAWIAMGLFIETIGSNMAYLKSRVNCNYNEISHPMMTRAGFSFLGAALGGVLSEVLPHLTDLWLAIALVFGSGGIAAAPWCQELLYLNLAMGATGLGRGLLIVASLSYGSQVWPEQLYHLVVLLLHFCYAIGASAAPQLTYLFESGTMDNILGIRDNGTYRILTNDHQGDNQTTAPPSGIGIVLPRAMYSFDVIALVCFLVGAAFLALLGTSLADLTHVSPETEEEIRESKAQNLKPVSWFVGHELPGIRIIFFVLVFCVLPLVTVSIFGRWLVEITHNALVMTSFWDRPTCLLLQTIFWAACAVGLILTPIARHCLPPNGLMITFTTMSLISASLLCVYIHKFVIFVWIFISLLGAFSAPVIPMGLTYCNAFVSQTPIGIALLTCFCSLSEILTSWQASFLFHHFGPTTLLYLAASASGLAFIFYLPIIPSLITRQWRPQPAGMKVIKGGSTNRSPQV